MAEYDTLGAEVFFEKYGFARPKRHWIEHNGKLYPAKAIVGAAYIYEHGAPPAHHSGGEARTNGPLRRLGFTIVSDQMGPSNSETLPESASGSEWTHEENAALARLYAAALDEEAHGQRVSKPAFLERAAHHLTRSPGSLSFKTRNLSFAATLLDLHHLGAFKPAENFQRSLVDALADAVMGYPKLTGESLPGKEPEDPVDGDVVPTLRTVQPPAGTLPEPSDGRRVARKTDYARREANNRSLGLAGERAVLAHYRRILVAAGRPDLAERVRHVAVEDGDGLGYDIHGLDPDGDDLFVEVKTTRAGATTPFFLSDSELRASREHGRAYRLVRVFDFESDQGPSHYVLTGPLDRFCELRATTYQAVPTGDGPTTAEEIGRLEYLPETDRCLMPAEQEPPEALSS